jgi:uroporphyrinogen decarboxylase
MDFAAVPEVWRRLALHFGTEDRPVILKHLGVDCRILSYDSFCQDAGAGRVDMDASGERSSTGPMWRAEQPDGSNRDIWGACRRAVRNEFGQYDELFSFPLGGVSSLEGLRDYRWPQPSWWDFSPLAAAIDTLNDTAVYSIRYRVGSVFETAWSLVGLTDFLLDLASAPAKPVYIMERIAEVHVENLRRVLEAAGDRIDIVYFYDDLATQESLLIGPRLYEQHIQPFHRRIVELAHRYGKPVMMHCCGSVYPLIPRLIDMGLAILNPVQTSAKNMTPEKLAAEFGGRIAFHGGIDVQEFLRRARPDEVARNVAETAATLGACGGYICAGSHHFQADTPLENILAMYSVRGAI